MKSHLAFSGRIVKSIPNMLTLCNSLCGFVAILYTLRAYGQAPDRQAVIFTVSAYMIFSAMIFDAFDGLAARLLHAGSMHGIQMDSLSDMVTFGVAPAVLVSVMTHAMSGHTLIPKLEIFVYALAAVYLGGAALRLATYNVKAMTPGAEEEDHEHFSGLPSPGAAAAICVAVIFVSELNLGEAGMKGLAFGLPIYAAVLGLLMVSRFPYIHAGRWIFSMRKSFRKFLLFLVLVICWGAFGKPALFVIVTGYIFSGPVTALVRFFRRRSA
ncbi:MAG: CDP-alcohol phosphatidyltransferase family protein [Victivallaceae bacterium]|nr:CDP-alcohol phosphatidyltransferase family protein [Victivallaceae bacterium]